MKPRLILLLSVLVGSLLGIAAWRWSDTPPFDSPPPTIAAAPTATTVESDPAVGSSVPLSTSPPTSPQRVAYVMTRPETALHPTPDDTGVAIAGNIVFPVLESMADGYRILDTCNNEGWVSAGAVDVGSVPQQRGDRAFDEAVFVIDPGHGLPDIGAVGPSGLTETEVNLDVAARLVALLRSSQDVDWATGSVQPGDAVPAAATAVLTRGPDGPNGGDYQLGLTFRATLANALAATAFVSIHHNASPEAPLDHPGSEAYVSLTNPESPRLGGLIVEELRSSLSRFEADWAGTPGNGIISRVSPDGSDYYTLLSVATVPAAIVEGAYISNPTEEALALTDAFRQAYAEAVYRALVRFVTTEDDPLPPPEPVTWDVDRPGPSMDGCEVPAP